MRHGWHHKISVASCIYEVNSDFLRESLSSIKNCMMRNFIATNTKDIEEATDGGYRAYKEILKKCSYCCAVLWTFFFFWTIFPLWG